MSLKNPTNLFLEEEEKKIIDEYKTQLSTQAVQSLAQQFEILEDKDSDIRSLAELKNRKKPTKEYFEMLALKKTLKDLDIEEKRILIRVHIQSKPYIPPTPEEEAQAALEAERIRAENEAKAKEEAKQAKSGKDRKSKKTKDEIAEEQARQKEEEEKKRFIESVDEKSLNEAATAIRMCLEQLAKLVIVLVSYGEPSGRPNPNTSVKYFWEYMRNTLDQICNYEETCKLSDMQEKIEAEVYPNNSCVILENIFHQPEEVGYLYDEEKKLDKLDYWQVQDFANLLSTYAPVYIIEDLYNYFKDYASLTKIKTEMTIFGPILSNDLTLVPQAFLHCAFQVKKSQSNRRKKNKSQEPAAEKRTIAVLGGDLTGDIILALDTILDFYDDIYVLGKTGIYFFMYHNGFKHYGTYILDASKHKLIEAVLKNAEKAGKIIHISEKLIVAPKPEAKEDIPEWITSIYNTRFIWPDAYDQYGKEASGEKVHTLEDLNPKKPEQPKKAEAGKKEKPDKDKKEKTLEEIPPEDLGTVGKGLSSNYLVVGYEQSFIQQLESEIYNARNIFWIGSLDPILRPGLNEANQSLALTIYNVKEERKPALIQNGISADWLVTCVGEDLLQSLNHFDIVLEAPPAMTQSRREDAMSEMEKSMRDDLSVSRAEVESVSKGTKIEKRNNIGLIADSYSSNTPFVLSLMTGRHLEGKGFKQFYIDFLLALDIITNYDKKNEDEEEEDFSFIDEI